MIQKLSEFTKISVKFKNKNSSQRKKVNTKDKEDELVEWII